MGVALVTKPLVTIKEEQGDAVFTVQSQVKSSLTSCTLLTIQSASVLKVCVAKLVVLQ